MIRAARRLVNLTHPIYQGMPVYPGAPQVSLQPHRLIERGHKYNSYAVRLFNHCGTHVDAPRHVYDEGARLSDFALEEYMFNRPRLVSLPAHDGEAIDRQRLSQALEPRDDCDFVIIRTGFERFRQEDPDRFASRNPGLAPEAVRWLVENLPDLRGLALDAISLSPGGMHEAGWQAHRIFLNPFDGRRLIVEDIHLPEHLPPLARLWIVPLIVQGIDSSWCTVLAEVGDRVE